MVDRSAETFNRHYSAISTDIGYEPPPIKQTASVRDCIVSEIRILGILDHPHHTTTGYDGLPAWFLRLTAPVYSGIIANLFNQSILQTRAEPILGSAEYQLLGNPRYSVVTSLPIPSNKKNYEQQFIHLGSHL